MKYESHLDNGAFIFPSDAKVCPFSSEIFFQECAILDAIQTEIPEILTQFTPCHQNNDFNEI